MDKQTKALMCTKPCRTCGEIKPLSEFPWQKKYGFRGDAPGSYRKDCLVCTAAKARDYRKTYVRTGSMRTGVDKLLYSACSCRVGDAKTRNGKSEAPFNITTDFMYDLLVKQAMRCALTGITMSTDKGSPTVLSIDQKEPGKGYVQSNVQWVCWAANRAKGDLSLEEFVSMCHSVVRCNDYPAREYNQVVGSAHQQ